MLSARTVALRVATLVGANVAAGRTITGPLRGLPLEHPATTRLRAAGGPRAQAVALTLSRSADTAWAIGIAAIATGSLAVLGARTAAAPGLAMSLASATHVVSSVLVGRPRPVDERLGTAHPTSSFPSGHVGAMTALATVLDGLAAGLPTGARVVLRLGMLGYLGLLGWSRVYTGQHHVTDVLAGYLNGAACGRWTLDALGPPERP